MKQDERYERLAQSLMNTFFEDLTLDAAYNHKMMRFMKVIVNVKSNKWF